MPPGLDQRRATVGHIPTMPIHPTQIQAAPMNRHLQQQQALPPHLQDKLPGPHAVPPVQVMPTHVGSMPYLPAPHPAQQQMHTNTLQHHMVGPWGRQRGSLQGFNMPPTMVSKVFVFAIQELSAGHDRVYNIILSNSIFLSSDSKLQREGVYHHYEDLYWRLVLW